LRCGIVLVMIDKSDWRLQGQERYLKAAVLVHRKYRRYPKNTAWDHDHCEFCFTTFMIEDYPDVLHVGYATEDDRHWICENCFRDFKDMFDWKVVEML
jgi:hypothetical protein